MTNLLDKLTNSVGGLISSHNTSNTAHEDIRQLIGSNRDNKVVYTIAYDLMEIISDIQQNVDVDINSSMLYPEIMEKAFISIMSDNGEGYNVENIYSRMVPDETNSTTIMEFYFEVDEEFDNGQLINFTHSINYINSNNKDVFSKSITIVENQYRYEVSSLNKELSDGSSGSNGSSLEDEMDTALSLELNNAITIQCKDTNDEIVFRTLIFDGETCTHNDDVDYYIVENVTDGEHSISGGQDITFHNSLQEALEASNPISNIIVSEEQRDFIIYRRVHDGR